MSDTADDSAYKYYAFISYSRKDSKAAAWLQRRLEWFRFPVKLVPEDRHPPNARYIHSNYRDYEGQPCSAALVDEFAACGVSRRGLSPFRAPFHFLHRK